MDAHRLLLYTGKMPGSSPKKVALSSVVPRLLTVLFVFIVAREILTPRPRHSTHPIYGCKANLKNLGSALEMYSQDWEGLYPRDLALLTPNYIKTIPECPEAMAVTYGYRPEIRAPGRTLVCRVHPAGELEECKTKLARLSFLKYEQPSQISEEEQVIELTCPSGAPYTFVSYWNTYEIYCRGENHKSLSVPIDHPRYNGVEGLVESSP